MRWSLDWGDKAASIISAATTGGRPVPPLPFLLNKVVPSPHLGFHWSAFSHLSSDRQMGWSVGPIPWTAIDRYAQRYGIDDPDEFDRFSGLIRAMDREFLAWHSEQKD